MLSSSTSIDRESVYRPDGTSSDEIACTWQAQPSHAHEHAHHGDGHQRATFAIECQGGCQRGHVLQLRETRAIHFGATMTVPVPVGPPKFVQ